MKTYILIIAFLLTGLGSINAQMPAPNSKSADGNGIIRGKVKDAKSGQMMEYANVVLLSVKDSSMVDGCITATDGSFELQHIPNGTYTLSIQFVGYTRKTIENITISRDQNTKDIGLIELEVNASNIGGV